MSNIAERAGVTRSRVQYYFDSTEHLLSDATNALLARVWGRYLENLYSGTGQSSDEAFDQLMNLRNDPDQIAWLGLVAASRGEPMLRRIVERAQKTLDEHAMNAQRKLLNIDTPAVRSKAAGGFRSDPAAARRVDAERDHGRSRRANRRAAARLQDDAGELLGADAEPSAADPRPAALKPARCGPVAACDAAAGCRRDPRPDPNAARDAPGRPTDSYQRPRIVRQVVQLPFVTVVQRAFFVSAAQQPSR